MTKPNQPSRDSVVPCDVDYIRKKFSEIGDGVHHSYLHQCLERRIPLQMGVLTDPFQQAENKYGCTYEILEILKEYDYPCIFITKGVVSEDYIDLLSELTCTVQYSITTLDGELARKLEPNAPTPQERLESMKRLSDAGVTVQHRYWPVLPKLTDEPMELFEAVSDAGARDVICSYLRFFNFKRFKERMNHALGFDYLAYLLKDYPLVKEKDYWTPEFSFKMSEMDRFRGLAWDVGLSFFTPNDPQSNGWQCCCGTGQYFNNNSPWALKLQGYRVGGGITSTEYLEGCDCPFEDYFKREWSKGRITKYFNDIEYNKNKEIYNRIEQKVLI